MTIAGRLLHNNTWTFLPAFYRGLTGGRLLFAIENRFGIKYFLGASEDHLQQPYVGIEGYKQPKTPRTFSKHELGEFIKGAGYNSNRFYYVYPDYKFPELICTDEYAPSYSSLKKISFTYAKNSALVLDEKDIYKDLIENDVWQFMANSYLVEAWNSNQNGNTNEQKVYYVSAKGETQKKYRVSTVIMNDGYAYKIPMHSQAEEHIQRIYENTKCLKERGISVLHRRPGDRRVFLFLWARGGAYRLYSPGPGAGLI